MMKKRLLALFSLAALASQLAACGAGAANAPAASSAGGLGAITVVSREDGSGTRGAFIELMGVEAKDEAGNKTDMTTEDAIITNKTDVMTSTVAGDPAAIGYISLGSLSDTVKALEIDGAKATPENVKSGAYPVSRPFHVATKGEPSGVVSDFLRFILSADGQAVVSDGYIAVNDAAKPFKTDGSSGKIVVGGSSSISPLMEKLAEAYQSVNAGAEIELQTSDSTSGMTGTIDGTYDIGMASRELKDEEKAALRSTAIALDGIAVIVNKENPITGLTTEQVQKIYTGEITDWSSLPS